MKLARFNSAGLYRDMDIRRAELGLAWKDVAAATGISASTLSRIKSGRDPDVHALASALAWLDGSAEKYIVRQSKAPRRKGKARG